MELKLEYYVCFGSGDYSDTLDTYVSLTEDETLILKRAKMLRLEPCNMDEFQDALCRAEAEISEMEEENLSDCDDEYANECLGKYPVDPYEINELVAERDEHTLSFFGLTELNDEELEDWDANDLASLPDVCDFVEDFEPESPFDTGYGVSVSIPEYYWDDELDLDEATQTLGVLFDESNGDFSVIDDYIERLEDAFDSGVLRNLARELAKSKGKLDFK